jgi:hypothetical protein
MSIEYLLCAQNCLEIHHGVRNSFSTTLKTAVMLASFNR